MKKLLLLVVGLLFAECIIVSSYAQTRTNNTARREVPLKAECPDKQAGAIARNLIMSSVEASIYGEQLFIEFLYPIDNATITLTDVFTGEVTYWNLCEVATNSMIDLSEMSLGEYKLEVTSSLWTLSGYFSISD